MNAVIAAILSRRSVRKYRPDPIADGERALILQAGLHAPSSKNAQAWHILAVQNAGVIASITEAVKAAILRAGVEKYRTLAENPGYRVNFGAAPLFTIVSADPARTSCPAEDCACLLQNMFLAAHSLGIGSCWVNQLGCVSAEPGFHSFLADLGLPPGHTVYGAAAFGYPAVEPKMPPRKEKTISLIDHHPISLKTPLCSPQETL